MNNKSKKKIPTEIYSRPVGYFRPLENWNKGKQEEFRQRKFLVLGGGRFRPEYRK